MSLNLIIPMAGKGKRFIKAGYRDHKPFIKINEKFMYEYVTKNFPNCVTVWIITCDKYLNESQLNYLKKNKLTGGVVGTLMTNLALEEYLKKENIPFKRSDVGDRYVAKMLYDEGWLLGGENSGHILITDKHTTGDGIISALQVLNSIVEHKTTIEKALKVIPMYPQILINIPLTKKIDLKSKI